MNHPSPQDNPAGLSRRLRLLAQGDLSGRARARRRALAMAAAELAELHGRWRAGARRRGRTQAAFEPVLFDGSFRFSLPNLLLSVAENAPSDETRRLLRVAAEEIEAFEELTGLHTLTYRAVDLGEIFAEGEGEENERRS